MRLRTICLLCTKRPFGEEYQKSPALRNRVEQVTADLRVCSLGCRATIETTSPLDTQISNYILLIFVFRCYWRRGSLLFSVIAHNSTLDVFHPYTTLP